MNPMQDHFPRTGRRRRPDTLAPALEHPLHRHRQQPGAEIQVVGAVAAAPHVLLRLQVLREEQGDVLVGLGSLAEELDAHGGAEQRLALDLGDGALAAELGAESFAALARAEAQVDGRAEAVSGLAFVASLKKW